MNDIPIPLAVKAAVQSEMFRSDISPDDWPEHIARTVLRAWPGAATARDVEEERQHIILPMSQEPRDAADR